VEDTWDDAESGEPVLDVNGKEPRPSDVD